MKYSFLCYLLLSLIFCSCENGIKPINQQYQGMPYEEEVFSEPKTVFNPADCPSFSYDEDEKFTILHLTDVHLDSNPSLEKTKTEVLNFIKNTIETEKPDLVIITGDLLFDSVSPVNTLQAFVDLMDGLKQNWAFCYGNHDREKICTSAFQNIIENSDYCVFQSGPDWVMGDSNYCIALTKDGQVRQALVLMDSNSYYQGNREVYSPIYNSQKYFYKWVSESLSVPLFAFFHIPIPEYKTLWEHREELGVIGTKGEEVCCPPVNTGFYNTAKASGTVAIFCGHDHVNDYYGKLESDGPTLVYGRSLGKLCYGNDELFGARLITLDAEHKTDF